MLRRGDAAATEPEGKMHHHRGGVRHASGSRRQIQYKPLGDQPVLRRSCETHACRRPGVGICRPAFRGAVIRCGRRSETRRRNPVSPSRKRKKEGYCLPFSGDPAGARTQDPNIKSVVLYQLSYGISVCRNGNRFRFGGANVRIYF